MGLYDNFPYTNVHELNTDWIVKKIKDIDDSVEAAAYSEANAKASEEAAADSQAAAAQSQEAASQSAADAQEDANRIEASAEQIAMNTARIDNILVEGTPTEGNAELIDARLGADGTQYSTLGQAVRDQALQAYVKAFSGLGYSNKLNGIVWTQQSSIASDGTIAVPGSAPNFQYSDPIAIETGYHCFIFKPKGTLYFNMRVHGYDENDNWIRQIGYMSAQLSDTATKVFSFFTTDEIKKIRISLARDEYVTNCSLLDGFPGGELFRGTVQDLNVTALNQCQLDGYYGGNTAASTSMTDMPADYGTGGAFTLFVYTKGFNSPHSAEDFVIQILLKVTGATWYRFIRPSGQGNSDWTKIASVNPSSMVGKNVAILGDSISTNGTDGPFPNVPEIEITSQDVGVTLRAYLTYYDVQAGLQIAGHTYTSAEIGTEVQFTPTAADVGKKIGLANNYNPASTTVWWEVAMNELGFNPIPACWSGSSITSHEADSDVLKTAHAWHDAQIRKCGIRVPGSMTRTAPDMIIIYRGSNDFSHQPYTVLTDDFFDNPNWSYPDTDVVSGNYGFFEGLALTIKKLRQAYPNAQIYLATLNVFKRVNCEHFPTNNGINTLPEYSNAIRKAADFFGCGVIEFDKDGITFENCYTGGYITDSATNPTHPNNKGHGVMGRKAIADIKAKYNSL